MRTISSKRQAEAFSLLELLCVMALITILAALLLPALSQARARAQRVSCVNYLHELGLGFQSFAHDHNSRFPMAVPAAAGGALEFVQNAYNINGEFYFSYRQFQALSNELVTPKMLVCAADTRLPALNFGLLQNSNVSYFVGVSADYAQPNSLLAGDGNLTNDWAGTSTFLRLGPGSRVHWTRELHQFKGNLLYADGRVVQRRTPGLLGPDSALHTADLFLPTMKSPLYPKPNPAFPPGPSGTAAVQSRGGPPNQIDKPPQSGAAQMQWSSDTSPSNPAATMPHGRTNVASTAGTDAPSSGPAEDPGFSLFPPWVSSAGRFILLTAVPWYLGLLLLLLAMAWLRRRLQPGKRAKGGN